MCERPGSIYENNVSCEQHYEDPVGQCDQATVPLGPPLSEGRAEQEVERQPANQAADHLQHQHGCVNGKNRLKSAPQTEPVSLIHLMTLHLYQNALILY